MNLLVIGMYWSGSSAVVDWLKGFENVEIIPGEFDIFRRPEKISSIIAVDSYIEKRKLAQKLLAQQKRLRLRRKMINDNRLVKVKNFSKLVLNFTTSRDYKISPIGEKKFDESTYVNNITIKYLKKYLQIFSKKEFSEIKFWKQWLEEILLTFKDKGSIRVFDQPVFLTSHVDIWTQLFNPFQVLLIHRNPADQFSEVIRQGVLNLKRGYQIDHHSKESFYNENDLSLAFSNMLQKKYQELFDFRNEFNSKFTSISFEDFVLNYSDKSLELKTKLELVKGEKISRFDPTKSVKNIGISKAEWTEGKITSEAIKRFNEIDNLRNKL